MNVEEEDEEDEDGGETTEWQTHWTDFLTDGRAIIANWTCVLRSLLSPAGISPIKGLTRSRERYQASCRRA